jgi:hypothetical protein
MRRSILKVKKVPYEKLDFERFSLFESGFKNPEILRFENAKNIPHSVNLTWSIVYVVIKFNKFL